MFINTNSKQEFCVLVDIEDVKLVVKHDRESAKWELFITQKRIIRIYGQKGMCVNWNNNCIHSVRAIARDHKLSTFEIAHVERVQWQSPCSLRYAILNWITLPAQRCVLHIWDYHVR